MEFISQEILDYAESKTSPESDVLQKLYRETHLKALYPRMISGHLQGRMLAMISSLVQPECILEVGTFTGYSCICLSEGLKPGGKIITLELNPELEALIAPYLEEAGIRDQVALKFGDAMRIIPTLEDTFDLVFIDADKQHYLDYYEMILPKMRPGGVLLADNVLWSGKVMDKAVKDKETSGIRAFNNFVSKDERVEKILLPLRDGIMIARKK